jgi:CxxC-x17-CxxC domain-containing protein
MPTKIKPEINFFAETTFRNQRKKFGIKIDDRRRHVYLIGKTGMGKTVMMKNMAIQDILDGKGVGFVDPHGEAAEELLDFIPKKRINDVIYLNPADLDYPVAFNIMEKVDVEHRHLVASGLMGVFKKIWPDVWSARMEYILNNSILALLEYPGSTLLGVNRMLADPEYRKKVVDKVSDPVVKSFWIQEFGRYTQRYEVEATAAIQNKVGQFISNPLIRNIIGQVRSSIDMRKVMDDKKILILNLSKGRIGEDNSRLLGALLITKIQLAAMSRVDVPEEKREDFFLYVDEFQNFATESFTNILSEARKYRLALILGHQYITQMEETVRDAVFGNVGTIICFRVGAEDAEFLEKEFQPEFMAEDLVGLPKYNIYLKLMIDGVSGSAFSAETLPPFPKPEESNREKIIKSSRERYSTSRKIIEEKISKWSGALKGTETPTPRSSAVLYDVRCSLCGKWTKVIFPPDGSRPVYCKACLKKVKEKRENPAKEKETAQTVSLREATETEPVPFFSRRPKEEKKPKRKEVDLGELKKVLEDSLKEIKPEEKKDENPERLQS